MATRPVSPGGQDGCGSAGGAPFWGGAPRRCPFLNTAGDGTQWDPRREEHSPLFVPLGFLVPVSQNPSWEAFSLVSGCNGVVIPRFASVPPSRPSGYPVPSPESAGIPLLPRQRPQSMRGSSPFAAPPPRRGHNGKLSLKFVKMAGSRLVPPHSLAFRPEWYPRAAHPTPRLPPQRATLRRAGTRRAEHSSTRSLAKPHREASRIKPTLSVRSHAAPTGISSGRIGTRTAARVRPPCGRTCLSHFVPRSGTPSIQASTSRVSTHPPGLAAPA